MMPHPVNLVVPGSAIAPITYICLLSLTTVDMTVRGFTVLDGANNPSPCQRSSSPPPAAYAPARKNVRPRVLRTGNYSTPVLSEICLPVEHLPAGIRWPA